MTMRLLKIILTLALTVVIAGAISLSFAPVVLVEWYYGINWGCICDPPFVVLNPFRDREAELAADTFLTRLRSHDLRELDRLGLDSEKLSQIKENEGKTKIVSWFAASRETKPGLEKITYWVERKYEGTSQFMQTGIHVSYSEGKWEVVGFAPTY